MLCTFSRPYLTFVDINRLRSAFLLASLAVLFVTALAARVDAQTTYTYTVIADVTNCSNFGSPAINNKGEVVFGARCSTPGDAFVIRRGDGGALTPIYTWTASSGTSNVPQTDVLSMNDNGVVAFAVNGPCPNAGAVAIWAGDGGAIQTVYDICTTPGFTSVIRPSINNAGGVAFMAASPNNPVCSGSCYDTVLLVSNGTTVTIAGSGTVTTSVGTLTAAIEPSINNNGVVTFAGQGPLNYGLFTGAGGAPTTITVDNPSMFNGISDSGRVVFLAGGIAVQTGDGGPVTTIATRTYEGGTYEGFPGSGAAISAAGKLAFLANLPSGGTGVFTGPDPVADVVLKTGDPIPGFGTVTGVSILREAINDSGQVAMVVLFDDNGIRKVAIIRADPPNNPPTASDGSASVTAGSSVSGTLSATDPDGEPLTYAIVANGTQGTAVIDDASTGAFTYTANAGASGDDTFTFQVTDIRGFSSNIATITVAIGPSSTCAVDVTNSIQQVKGRASKNTGTTRRFLLSNTSSTAIAGPISLVLDSLSPAGTTLTNAAGFTACTTPTGSPYVNVDVGSDSIWSPGEGVEIVLEFTLQTSGPGKKPAITYTRRVLAGTGAR